MTRPSVAAEVQKYPSAAAHSNTNLLLGMNNPYAGSSARTSSGSQGVYNPNLAASQIAESSSFNYGVSHQLPNTNTLLGSGMTSQVGGDMMMIESQDIDVNTLHQNQDTFPFSFSNDFVPWLEYLPQDVLSFFEEQHQGYATATTPATAPAHAPMMGDGQPRPQ